MAARAVRRKKAAHRCEDCHAKRRNFGVPGSKARWCGDCSKGHSLAVKHEARAVPPLRPALFYLYFGTIFEEARLDAAGAIKVNLRETCILLSIEFDRDSSG